MNNSSSTDQRIVFTLKQTRLSIQAGQIVHKMDSNELTFHRRSDKIVAIVCTLIVVMT